MDKIKEIGNIAKLDIYRDKRCGIPEVIFAEGKEPQWVAKFLKEIVKEKGIAIATRIAKKHLRVIKKICPQILH